MVTGSAGARAEGGRARHDPHRALLRTLYASIAGACAAAAVWGHGGVFAALSGWNAAGLVLLALSWVAIFGATADSTRRRAGSEDPGRTVVYVLVLALSTVGLFAAVALSRQAKSLPPDAARELAAMCLLTVTVCWLLLHTAFTLRYARLYYREDHEGVGGVEFPGKHPPTYLDFAYFSFTIGMCFQTSDVCVTSAQIRHAVLLHAIIAFAYNTAILAFVLNLVFGQA